MASDGTSVVSATRSAEMRAVAVMPGRMRGSGLSSTRPRSKFLTGGQPDEKSTRARTEIRSTRALKSLPGTASIFTTACCPTFRRPRSDSSSRASRWIDDRSGSSRMLAPAQTRSPSWNSVPPPPHMLRGRGRRALLRLGLLQPLLGVRQRELRLLILDLRDQIALAEIELRALDVVLGLEQRRLLRFGVDLLLRLDLLDFPFRRLEVRLP